MIYNKLRTSKSNGARSDLYYSYCRGTVGTPTKFGREHAFFDVTSDILTKIVSGTLAILAALIERAPSTKISKARLFLDQNFT